MSKEKHKRSIFREKSIRIQIRFFYGRIHFNTPLKLRLMYIYYFACYKASKCSTFAQKAGFKGPNPDSAMIRPDPE